MTINLGPGVVKWVSRSQPGGDVRGACRALLVGRMDDEVSEADLDRAAARAVDRIVWRAVRWALVAHQRIRTTTAASTAGSNFVDTVQPWRGLPVM